MPEASGDSSSGTLGRNESPLDNTVVHGQDHVHMTAISYTAARENLASTMDQVCDDHDPVIITRNRDQAVVMLSLEDFEALQETAYLLRSPANAKRLIDSIEALNKGTGIKKTLSELQTK
jgi:antitoxin YefM